MRDHAIRAGYPNIVFLALIWLLPGCGSPPSPGPIDEPGRAGFWSGLSDLEQVQAADISVLFIGNSHTTAQDLPNLVCRMIQFRHPEKKVYAHVVAVFFLEDAEHDPRCRQEIDTRPWKYVVLQAQKISMSGRYQYSQKEGIDFAKRARDSRATVLFFSEWGRKDVPGEGQRHEKIYQEMARAADAQVLPIGRAWDRALAQRPGLPLHDPDGNHESPQGAFLTACVLVGQLTGESPAGLGAFPYPALSDNDRRFLAETAAQVLAPEAGSRDQPERPARP